jgi:hypothetical protein
MIEDTSPRAEWYEEYREPDVPPFIRPGALGNLQIAQGPWHHAPVPQLPVAATRIPKVGELLKDRDGVPIGVVADVDLANGQITIVRQSIISWARQAGKLMSTSMHAIAEAATKLAMQSNFVLFPPALPEETVKERALRLAKQPHSMTQDPDAFHFDHRGRRRY